MLKYGILNMAAQWEVLPMAQERNVGVINMSPVRVKMTRPDELEKTIARWKQEGFIPENALPDKNPLDFLVHGDTKSVVAAGYKFSAMHPAISTMLIGTGNIKHLEENIETILGPPLPEDDYRKLCEIFGSFAESEGDTG